MKPVILDVDTGIDDAIAILLAVASKEIDLIGITTVSGNVHVEKATRNTKRVLKLINREDIPVHKGRGNPLVRPLVDASQVHGRTGLNGQLEDYEVKVPTETTAIDFLKKSINDYGRELTVITTGPLTNIATVLQEDSSLAGKLGRLISMGGVVAGRGNHTPVAEYNILTDPEAAALVLESGLKDHTLISLDVTRKALLKKEHLKRIKNPLIRDFIEKLTVNYMKRYSVRNGIQACPMHDPLTVLHMLDPSIIQTQEEYVVVETDSRYCDGMTVCDFDRHYQKSPNIKVARSIDIDRFEDLMFNLFNQLVEVGQ